MQIKLLVCHLHPLLMHINVWIKVSFRHVNCDRIKSALYHHVLLHKYSSQITENNNQLENINVRIYAKRANLYQFVKFIVYYRMSSQYVYDPVYLVVVTLRIGLNALFWRWRWWCCYTATYYSAHTLELMEICTS